MANARHKDQTITEGIHIVYAFEYANAAARTGATGLLPADVGKMARQLDNDTFWILQDDSPLTWQQVASGGSQDLSSVLGNGNTTGGNGIILSAGDPLTFNENASVPGGAPGAGLGKVWVRNDTPNVLVFTDDAGTDTVLGLGGTLAETLALGNTTGGNGIILSVGDPLTFNENASVPGGAPGAGLGKLWVRNDAPNVPVFTNDAGTDLDLVALAGQLGGTAAVPDVRGLRETGGPTLLTLGAIADGETLIRSGSTIIGSSGGSGDPLVRAFSVYLNLGSRAISATPTSPLYNAAHVTIDTNYFTFTLGSSTEVNCVKDGKYLVLVSGAFYFTSSAGGLFQSYVTLNGTPQTSNGWACEDGAADDSGQLAYSFVADLSAGDDIGAFFNLSSGKTGFFVEDKNQFVIIYLGDY